ncbi:hypothetical protein JW877_08345 [bacterium]|nr:hypothetical protein [bacterium]
MKRVSLILVLLVVSGVVFLSCQVPGGEVEALKMEIERLQKENAELIEQIATMKAEMETAVEEAVTEGEETIEKIKEEVKEEVKEAGKTTKEESTGKVKKIVK